MKDSIEWLSTFVANTCVIVVFAYLLTRGRPAELLFQKSVRVRDSLYLGFIFGAMSLLELLFAGSKYHYETYTLIVTFAAVNAGERVAAIPAASVAVGAVLLHPPSIAIRFIIAVLATLLIGLIARRINQNRTRFAAGLIAVVLSEAVTILLQNVGRGAFANGGPVAAVASMVENVLGLFLLQLIVNDARARSEAELYRAEVERARTLIAEAEFEDLRAKVHPHFLYNALNSIAGLCLVSPERAAETLARLSQLMRRAIEIPADALIPLTDELEYVRDYLEIERIRLGNRLTVHWRIDDQALAAKVPPLSVQMLVENAIIHGIAPRIEPGAVVIEIRRRGEGAVIGVMDDGTGIPPKARAALNADRPPERPHGMQITNQQLLLLLGRAARIRVFNKADGQGAIVAFQALANANPRLTRPGIARRRFEEEQPG